MSTQPNSLASVPCSGNHSSLLTVSPAPGLPLKNPPSPDCSVELSEMQDPPFISLPTANLLLPLLPTGSMALRRGSLTRPGSAPWMSRCVSNTSPCAPLPCAALHPTWLPSLSSFLDAGDSQYTTHLSPSLGKCSCFQPLLDHLSLCLALEQQRVVCCPLTAPLLALPSVAPAHSSTQFPAGIQQVSCSWVKVSNK